MITNEEFRKCTELCNERSALLQISKEINAVINNTPETKEQAITNFYYENHSYKPYIIPAVSVFFIAWFVIGVPLLTYSKISDNISMYITFALSLIIAIIIGVICRAIYYKKLDKRCDIAIERNERKWEEYNKLLPERKSFSDEVNIAIKDVTNQIISMNAIPEKYWYIANELWYFVTVHEAEDYREAVRIWEDIQHKNVMENMAREQAYYSHLAADYAEQSKKYAYESMVASQKAKRNTDISLLLNTYTALKVSEY